MPTYQIHRDALEQTLLEMGRLGMTVVSTSDVGDHVEIVTVASEETETR